jgi:MSHA biogenesis protein MshO
MPFFRQQGVTLIEMIVAIVVTGILLSLVGMFTRNQIAAYFDVSARAELSDAADTALRRIARELQGALPNSVRAASAGSERFLEFVPIRDAGRYRAQSGGGAGDDPIDLSSTTDNSFDVLGPTVTVAANDSLVIYNLGIPGADVYAGTTRRPFSVSGTLQKLSYTVGASQFPFASPQNRFQIVSGPVTYHCTPNAANPEMGTITREWCYNFSTTQPTSFATTLPGCAAPASSVLVSGVSACELSYTPGALERNGLVSMRLVLSRNGESVTLLHQVDVMNTP